MLIFDRQQKRYLISSLQARTTPSAANPIRAAQVADHLVKGWWSLPIIPIFVCLFPFANFHQTHSSIQSQNILLLCSCICPWQLQSTSSLHFQLYLSWLSIVFVRLFYKFSFLSGSSANYWYLSFPVNWHTNTVYQLKISYHQPGPGLTEEASARTCENQSTFFEQFVCLSSQI